MEFEEPIKEFEEPIKEFKEPIKEFKEPIIVKSLNCSWRKSCYTIDILAEIIRTSLAIAVEVAG